jgi:hypothetical protein
MSRARFCAVLEPARLDAVPGTILSSRRQTMTRPPCCFELGTPIRSTLGSGSGAGRLPRTIGDQAVVTQIQTYKNEEGAFGPRSFTHGTELRASTRWPSP